MDPYHQESQSPPTLQGDFAPPSRPTSWPKVLGIIAIVFGALGSLANLWAAVAPLFMNALASMMPNDPSMKASLQAQKDLAPYSISAGVFNFIGSLMLLLGGIGLCLRTRWGASILKVWIPWRMVGAIVASVVGYMGMQATMKAMQQQPNQPPGVAMMGGVFGIVTMAIGVVWGWAYPVFLLIWFSRSKIREEVKTWR